MAFHLQEALGLNKKTNKNTVHRVTFNEITKPAILNAFDHPRHIDMDLVNAQQARRVIDRLVGYGLSPLLWKKIRFGLSAGRVQSVAVKIVVDREKEIQAFNPEEYWTLEGTFLTKGNESIVAKLTQEEGKKIELKSGQQTQKVLDAIEGQPANITDMSSKNRKKKPAAPFITSTLQQAASSRMGWSVKKTMQVAQKLYEGIGEYGGLITYMRTDSNNLSKTATDQARDIIGKEYGADYLPKTAISYGKKSKNAQEAHEAIRPTDFSKKPGTLPKLNEDQARLYDLIWKRAIASQMSDAQFLQTGINIGVANYTFRATGQQLVFPGFLTVYVSGDDKDQLLPKLENNETLVTEKYDPEQHYTKPPARYNEASLVKKMEEEGIGRPSTYAPTITTIQSRGYIQKEGAQLIPTEVAFVVTKLLEGHFEDIVSLGFTAGMEDKLDEVAE
ncbi:MAG: type I DNA topoisomerase [Patescibacteria group bacterium]|nr:type I DNA topoisomerase [Patescibacteria group bacterium]